MTRRLALIALWLLAGHLTALGLFWTLLQVPESSSLMLLASTLVALAAPAWTAAVTSTTARASSADATSISDELSGTWSSVQNRPSAARCPASSQSATSASRRITARLPGAMPP